MMNDNLRGTGRSTEIIKTIDFSDEDSIPIFVAGNHSIAKHLIDTVGVEIHGYEKARTVDCRSIHYISKWGRGLSSDRFYFDHTAFEETLIEEDSNFMKMMFGKATVSQLLDLETNKEFHESMKPINISPEENDEPSKVIAWIIFSILLLSALVAGSVGYYLS